MSIESVVGKIIIMALVGIGLYAFFALVDLIRTKGSKQMIKQTTCYCCDKPIEPEWLPEGEFIVCDECSSAHTDKLLVEKLQEQLNTAKKYIEHVIGTIKHDGHLGTIQTDWILPDLEKSLAAIVGDDEK